MAQGTGLDQDASRGTREGGVWPAEVGHMHEGRNEHGVGARCQENGLAKDTGRERALSPQNLGCVTFCRVKPASPRSAAAG